MDLSAPIRPVVKDCSKITETYSKKGFRGSMSLIHNNSIF